MNTQLSNECRTRLFRITLETPAEGVAFVMADSREAAWRIGKTVMAVLRGIGIYDVALKHVHSFAELVAMGKGDDEDLRIFEVAYDDENGPVWAGSPYFLTNDSSLLGKWAELCADLAADVARMAIRRAK
ncbi:MULTISPECIES: hypothetical protein [unclassified Caballeronia]|uniref:hypothetical protein n=1 Tax=unclassified Caballeronia TaxID=2646786 RepID=UPI001FD10017|nr:MULTISPECIES: hypothetical protein [unclassified Caballeronia]